LLAIREKVKGLIFHSQVSVFGDSCQRGRKYEPKAKGPHHHQSLKMKFIQIDILLCSKGVLFKSKKKHLKQGEKISNLENASFNLIHVPLTICKRFLKRIVQRICKNKTRGANEVQNFK
jgi:hypothetical protein